MVKKRRRNRKWLYGGLILMLVVVAVVIGVAMQKGEESVENEEKAEAKTEKVVEKTVEGNGEGEDEVDLAEKVVSEKKTEQYDGNDPNEAGDLSGVVTYAGVLGANLVIRVNIDQYLMSGSCELTLTRGGVIIYSSIASVVGGAMTATCEGFDVSVGELGEGKIDVNVKISADGRSGVIRGEANI